MVAGLRFQERFRQQAEHGVELQSSKVFGVEPERER